MQAQQRVRRGHHRLDVQRSRPRCDEAGILWFRAMGCQRQPIHVVPAQCREARVESRRCPADLAHPDIVGKESGEPAHQRGELAFGTVGAPRVGVAQHTGVDIGMRHLTTRVHTGVGASGGEQSHGRPKHGRQRLVEDPRYGANPALGRPAVEVRAVVGDIEPESHRPVVRTRQPRPILRPFVHRRSPRLRLRSPRVESRRRLPGPQPSWRPWWPHGAPDRPRR